MFVLEEFVFIDLIIFFSENCCYGIGSWCQQDQCSIKTKWWQFWRKGNAVRLSCSMRNCCSKVSYFSKVYSVYIAVRLILNNTNLTSFYCRPTVPSIDESTFAIPRDIWILQSIREFDILFTIFGSTVYFCRVYSRRSKGASTKH